MRRPPSSRFPRYSLPHLSPLALSSMALAVLTACGTVPTSNPALDNAVASLRQAHEDATVREHAAAELQQADDALARARAAQASSDRGGEVDHLAYLARQRIYIAQEVAGRRRAERDITGATVERDRVRLAARTRQADQAERRADSAERQADAATRSAVESQRLARASALQTAVAGAVASAAQQQAQDAQMRADGLTQLLIELDARQTQRGMVITIGDVLFDTSRSGLKADGQRNVDRLVNLLRQHPNRRVLIEGYTDSVGSDDRIRAWGGMGAFWGGIWGLLVGPAVFMLPGLGVVALAGPLAAALVAALEGAVVVGSVSALTAALTASGMTQEQAIRYESELKADRYILMVHGSADDITLAHTILAGMRAWKQAGAT